jgi:hypothetical protein
MVEPGAGHANASPIGMRPDSRGKPRHERDRASRGQGLHPLAQFRRELRVIARYVVRAAIRIGEQPIRTTRASQRR